MKKKVLAALIAAMCCMGAIPISSMAENSVAERSAKDESSLKGYAEAILEYMYSNSIQGGTSHDPDEKLLTVSYRGNYGEQLKTFIDELGLDKSNIKYELEELPEFIAFSEPDAVTTPATTIAVTGTNTVTTITMPVVDDPNLITSVATVIIMDVSGDVILVKPVDGSAELKSSSKFSLSAKQLPADITPKTGMKLEITYNGGILETYPAMFGNIQKITVATETDTDKEGATWLKGTKDMTLKDVIELAKKGNDLDWSDFKDFNGRDVGSGLHIWEYKLEDGYVLDVGGDIMTKPMYILLKRNNDKSIDIRTDDVKEYIASTATPVVDDPSIMTSDYTMTVTVIEINGSSLLVKNVESSGDVLTLPANKLDNGINPVVGMKLEVTYNGGILVTYPGQFSNIQKVMVLSEITEIVAGDANLDGQVDMSDAVLIMQALANPNKYGIDGTVEHHLTEQGKLNADMDGDGLTVGDAQAIQKKLLGLDKADSQSIDSSLIANKLFRYEKSADPGILDDLCDLSFGSNGTYFYHIGYYKSSNQDQGTWTISGDTVVLTGQYGTNKFRYEDKALVYIAEGSDGFSDLNNNHSTPKDGEKFNAVFE